MVRIFIYSFVCLVYTRIIVLLCRQRSIHEILLILSLRTFLHTLVALNFQTAGVEMDLNDGLFSQNGRCGYILKPEFMRSAERGFDPDHPQNYDGYQPLKLSIQVRTNVLVTYTKDV